MSKTVWFLVLFAFPAHALIPVDGILMGVANEDIQSDPLGSVFNSTYDLRDNAQNAKLKLYQASYESGLNLGESCSYLGVPTYTTNWQEKQARRSMAATLQYLGLDFSIKAIGAYAKKLDVGADDYKRLTKNLVNNYCSKNITVFSLKTIEKSLEFYYKNPMVDIIPNLSNMNFAPSIVKNSTDKPSARSREFDLSIKNFRAFCSWGGEVEDYRMMAPFLANKFVMSFVIKNMLGIRDQMNEKTLKVSLTSAADSTIHVACTDLICRNEPYKRFQKIIPMIAGSTGLENDLPKNYCHHFRFLDYPQKTSDVVKKWIKASDLEDPIFETSHFISLMTGIPDLFNGAETYQNVAIYARSSIDEKWNQWANRALSMFSKDLLYEEALKVKIEPRRDQTALSLKGFQIDLSVTLGEMDRLLASNDKLAVSFNLNLTKNYIREIRTKWKVLEDNIDLEGQAAYRKDIARYLDIQIKDKHKLFPQIVWNEDFSRLLAEELIQQARYYRGSMFDSYQDEVIKVPVRFTYGLFAISYLRYRSDVKAGRVRLAL